MMSKLGTASAFFTFVSVLLAAVFAGVEGKPAGYDPVKLGEPIVTAFPVKGTTFVNGIIVGAVVYAYSGNQYVTAPAFGSLTTVYKKAAFSFMIPTIIFLGCLYASVTARFVFFRLFRNSKHLHSHTVVGWGSWAGILLVTWIFAFIIAQVIPFFNSLLSVMSSLFDSWFGFIFWGVAYFRMREADKTVGRKHSAITDRVAMVINFILIVVGIVFLTVGTYASVQGIIDQFEAGTVSGVFECASNGI